MSTDSIRTITTAEEADALVSDALLEEVLDWFEDQRGVPTEAFIDRLCDTYADGWELDNYDNAAARRILRRARKIKQ